MNQQNFNCSVHNLRVIFSSITPAQHFCYQCLAQNAPQSVHLKLKRIQNLIELQNLIENQTKKFNRAQSIIQPYNNFIEKMLKSNFNRIEEMNQLIQSQNLQLIKPREQLEQDDEEINAKIIRSFQWVVSKLKELMKEKEVNRNQIQQQYIYSQIYEKNANLCFTMAMDKDERILVNGQFRNIQIQSIQHDGSIKLEQTLSEHEECVNCLCFSKKGKWFISAGNDNSIRIWWYQEKWICKQAITVGKDKENNVTHIILTPNEDQFIACYSEAKKIQVWRKNNEQWKQSQLLSGHTNQLHFISLSADGQLLASNQTNQIIIWHYKQESWQEWTKLNGDFNRMCFVGNKEIIASSEQKGRFSRFSMDEQGQLELKHYLELDHYKDDNTNNFPIIYNSEARVAMFRHFNLVYVLKQMKNGNFAVHQKIYGDFTAGYLMRDGKSFILSCDNRRNIQVYNNQKAESDDNQTLKWILTKQNFYEQTQVPLEFKFQQLEEDEKNRSQSKLAFLQKQCLILKTFNNNLAKLIQTYKQSKQEINQLINCLSQSIVGIQDNQSIEDNVNDIQIQQDKEKFTRSYQWLINQLTLHIGSIFMRQGIVNHHLMTKEGDYMNSNYKLVTEQHVKICLAIVMDKDERILVKGDAEQIQIWDHFQGTLTLKHTLDGHQKPVNCLCFSKKEYWFISSGDDCTMKIWIKRNDNWYCRQKIEEFELANHILINNEIQFISGHDDRCIRIWVFLNEQWLCNQTLISHNRPVQFLSLSPNAQFLASQCQDNKIIIWQSGLQWEKKGEIEGDYNRICFISNSEIVATNNQRGSLSRVNLSNVGNLQHESDLQLDQYKEANKNSFPIIYNAQFKLVILRHFSSVYILKQKDDGEFQVYFRIYGNYRASYMLRDGQYLFLACQNRAVLQLWKLQ